jgi:hypothetical protein
MNQDDQQNITNSTNIENKNKNERCKQLISSIENISQNEMEEIFKMIHNHGCDYTRNNNGLFINLTWIPDELLKELEQYVKFCNRSQRELQKYESICDVLNTKLREDSSNSKIIREQKNKLPVKPDLSVPIIDENIIHPNIDETIEADITEHIHNNEEEANIADIEKTSKISSSMKFAILKKRYSKIGILNTNNIENDLKKEIYSII